MHFRVKTLSASGTVSRELRQADNAEMLREELQAAEQVVLSIRPAWFVPAQRSRSKTVELHLIFCDQLQTLLGAGISIPESLSALRDSERDMVFHTLIGRLLADVETGCSLSQAMAAHPDTFPPILTAMLRAAEKTGALGEALGRYSQFRRQVEDFRSTLWSAAAYPLLLLAVGGAVILFLMLYVVPRFALVYQGLHGPLPWSARMLLAWGEFADGRAGTLLLALLCLLGAAVVSLKQKSVQENLRRHLARLPHLGPLLHEIQLAHYFHSLSLLLTAGIPLLRALTLSREILAQGLREAADAVTAAVAQGERLSLGLEQQALVTPVALRLIQAGERSGRLSQMLGQAAEFHDRRVLRTTAMLSRLIGPLLMAVMGLLIGGIVVLLYMPIFQLADGLA